MNPNFYYYNLCHTCKQSSQNIKTCASCKAISYCSKDHQIKDWPDHKVLCKVIKDSREQLPLGSNLLWDDWILYRTRLRCLWLKQVRRELQVHEDQMWMFPKVCAVCFSRDVKINCNVCLNASYCSQEHQEKHSKLHNEFCDLLKTSMEVDQYLFSNNVLQTAKFLKFEIDAQTFPENIQDLMNLVEIKLEPSIENETVAFIQSVGFITPAATLLYSLEKIGFIKNRQIEGGNLTIHIVGAGVLENWLNWSVYVELLCHWINNLRKLKIFLIGPEIIKHPEHAQMFLTIDLCSRCTERRVEVCLDYSTSLYHDIADVLPKPDCLLLYNPGLHEFENTKNDSWNETLPFLVKSEVPVIMTSYTLDEMVNDLKRIQTFEDMRVVLGPEKNPFKCCRPYRDWESYTEPVFYSNAQLCVLDK